MNRSADGNERDKVLASTGWGVKPDDQPANAEEVADNAKAPMRYDRDEPDILAKILQRQRRGFNKANRVRVGPDEVVIYDINGDSFTVTGLGYGDPKLIELLIHLGASFDPRRLGEIPADDPKVREYELSRSWAWGAERTG